MPNSNKFQPGAAGWAIVLEDKTYKKVSAPLTDAARVPTHVDGNRVINWSNNEKDLDKVFANLTEWMEEFRMYHRKDGLIVKERDDLMSATRIAIMMLRIATSPKDAPVRDKYARRREPKRNQSWMTS